MRNKKLIPFLVFVAIIFLGFFLRVYHIEQTPPGIYPDEAINGEDALHALTTGDYRWFYTANNGREGLFMNLISFSFYFFGETVFALKLPSIVFGTLTIWGIYLLSQEVFQKRSTSLIAAFLVAVSFWPINFSRIAFRAIMLPAVLSFSFYFLWKGMRTKKIWPFIWGGLIFGIGIHSYIAFRIAPVILLLMLVVFWVNETGFWKKYWKQICLFILACLLTALPMFYTFYAHPEYFDSRSDEVSIFSSNINHGHLFLTFLRSFSLSLVKYNFWGDQNWRHNYPPYPILDPLVGIAFLFGFFYAIIQAVKSIIARVRKKLSAPNKMNVPVFLLAWFFIMLSPEFLTAEGLPHALRSIGTLPAVFLLAAMSFEFLIGKAERRSALVKKTTLSVLVFLLIFIGFFNFFKYQFFWAHKEKVGLSFNKNLQDMTHYIQSLPPEEEKFVVTSWNRLENAPIDIFTRNKNVYFFYPDELEKIQPQGDQPFVILFTENNQTAISFLSTKFPYLNLSRVDNTLDSVYYLLK